MTDTRLKETLRDPQLPILPCLTMVFVLEPIHLWLVFHFHALSR